MNTLSLKVDGMTCQHCVRSVEKALTAVPGVSLESVRLGEARMSYDPAQASAEVITEAVHDAGYSATAVLVHD